MGAPANKAAGLPNRTLHLPLWIPERMPERKVLFPVVPRSRRNIIGLGTKQTD